MKTSSVKPMETEDVDHIIRLHWLNWVDTWIIDYHLHSLLFRVFKIQDVEVLIIDIQESLFIRVVSVQYLEDSFLGYFKSSASHTWHGCI